MPTGNFVETFGRLIDCGRTAWRERDLFLLGDRIVVDLGDDQLIHSGGYSGGRDLLVGAGRDRDPV